MKNYQWDTKNFTKLYIRLTHSLPKVSDRNKNIAFHPYKEEDIFKITKELHQYPTNVSIDNPQVIWTNF